MKIKTLIAKPRWWDNCNNIILRSNGCHKAVIKEHNGMRVLFWELLEDGYFSIDKNGDEFNNEEELRLYVEVNFVRMAEEMRTMFIKLTLNHLQLEKEMEATKLKLSKACETIMKLTFILMKNFGEKQ